MTIKLNFQSRESHSAILRQLEVKAAISFRSIGLYGWARNGNRAKNNVKKYPKDS